MLRRLHSCLIMDERQEVSMSSPALAIDNGGFSIVDEFTPKLEVDRAEKCLTEGDSPASSGNLQGPAQRMPMTRMKLP